MSEDAVPEPVEVAPDTLTDSEYIADIHSMVVDVHTQIMSIVPLIQRAGPVIDQIAEEVKAKGILGLMPMIISGFRGQ